MSRRAESRRLTAPFERLYYNIPGFLAKTEKLKPFVVAFNGKKAVGRLMQAGWDPESREMDLA